MSGIGARLSRRLPAGGIERSVAVLVGSTAVGQGLAMLAQPIVTRLYGPDSFGTLAIFTSIVSILAVLASLRYELAIPLPKDEESAASLLALSLSLIVVVSAVVGLVAWFAGERLFAWAGYSALTPYRWLIPIGLLVAGLYQALNAWAIRREAYRRVARTQLTQSLSQLATQLVLGVARLEALGLLIGRVVGFGGGSTSLAALALREDRRHLRRVTWDRLRDVASRYRRFPLLSSWSSLLNSVGLELPALFLAAFYGTQITGWFALGQRVVAAPMTLVGRSVSQVYMGEASRLLREDPGGLRGLFVSTVRRLSFLGSGPIIALGIVAPWVFGWVFGSDWTEAGRYVQALAPMFLLQFIVSPLSGTVDVLERQDLHLVNEVLRIAFLGGGVGIAVVFDLGGLGAVIALSAMGTISYTAYGLICWYAVVAKGRQIEREKSDGSLS